MVRALLLMAVPGAVFAQFTNLTTAGDGSTLYFASERVLAPSAPREQSRIYRADGSGVALAFERTRQDPLPPSSPQTPVYSNYYSVFRAESSRDGYVIALTAGRSCWNSNRCLNAVRYQTTVRGFSGTGEINVNGQGRLSGNGRYLVTYNDNYMGSPITVTDLATGQSHVSSLLSSYLRPGASRVVADDGTAVFAPSNSALYVLQQDKQTRIPAEDFFEASEPVIDAAGRRIAFTHSDWNGQRGLYLYELDVQRNRVLVPGEGTVQIASPFLSADGARVAFLRSGRTGEAFQLWAVNSDGSGLRQVTNEPDGLLSAAVSDDGRVAWYLSGGGRIHQVFLNSGAVVERVGRNAQMGRLTVPLVAGSVGQLLGVGFADEPASATSFPLPTELAGVRVRLDGADLQLLSVSSQAIQFQVPWESPTSPLDAPGPPRTLEVLTAPTTSMFVEEALQGAVWVHAARGWFVANEHQESTYGGLDVLAIHENWDSFVTPSNPAMVGEVIHLYGGGFGRVAAPPATGMPAEGPQPVVEPVTCWTWKADNSPGQIPIAVLYAGLAPGLVGYYQMDMRIPEGGVRASMQFYCNGEGNRETPYSGDFFGSFAVRVY